jgi:Tesmin/TSO1-like CXC domain, cysteine-rich domain
MSCRKCVIADLVLISFTSYFHFCSSPGPFRSGSDGKGDTSFDLFGFRSTPAKGRSPGFDLSSPRSTGLQPPPVPIFQPSPRRASDASTYISPESRNRRSSLASSGAGGKAFSFSPQPNFASSPPSGAGGGAGTSAGAAGTSNTNANGASFTSVFASILGDAHSRISPTNLSAAAAAARDGSAVRAHFGGIFSAADAAAAAAGGPGAGPSTGGGAANGDPIATAGRVQPGSMVPVEGLHHPSVGSPLQLHHSGRTTPSGTGGDDADEEDEEEEDNDGYDAIAARRPSRRRALDFDGAVDGGGGINGNDANINSMNNINGNGDSDGMNKYEIPNPLSPSIGPVVIESIEALLPIPRLRDSGDEEGSGGGSGSGDRGLGGGRVPMLIPSSTRGVSGTTAGGVSLLPGLTRGSNGPGPGMSFMDSLAQSPISMRPGIMRREDIIDSPAVKEATNAAVAAAMQANAERRPARAAAAGAAAAAAAAAGGTPMSRRPSAAHHAAGINSGLFDPSGLLSATGGVPAGGIRCNCKKSKCMKLYCDCFKALGYCGEGCSCVGCSNREDNAPAVSAARESILQRNPQAFTEKISSVDPADELPGGPFGGIGGSLGLNGGGGGGGQQAQHRRGCNCKKSKCLKKYCECFQAGIACGDSCKCDGCHNTTEAVASGRPPFDKKRLQQQVQQQQQQSTVSAVPVPVVQQPSVQQQVQQQLQLQMQMQQQRQLRQQQQQQEQQQQVVKTSSGEESGGGGGSGSAGTANANANPTTSTAAAAAAPAAAKPGMPQQAFAALGPAFQQILLQRAFTGNNGAATANGGAGTPPPAGQAGKPGSLTVNNQLLVPISWPLGAAGGVNGNAHGTPPPNATTAQQLLNLAASGAIPAFSNQVAAAVAAAQKNVANLAAAQAAAAQAAHAIAHTDTNTNQNGNGPSKATPSVGPSSQDENPTTTTQPSDGTEGTEAINGDAPRPAALLDGGMSQQTQQQGAESNHQHGTAGNGTRKKPPLPTNGTATDGDEDAKPRLTPTKRKPARTMTAALM